MLSGKGSGSIATSLLAWVPPVDDTYWIGSATLGFKGFHMPDTLITDDVGVVKFRNNADNAYVGIMADGALFGTGTKLAAGYVRVAYGTTPASEPTNQGLLSISCDEDATHYTYLRLTGYGGSGTSYPLIAARGARGTAAVPTASQTGDVLGGMHGNGYGATRFGYHSGAVVDLYAAEAWTDTTQGTYVTVETTLIGTACDIAGAGGVREVARWTDKGWYGLGCTDPIGLCEISSNDITTNYNDFNLSTFHTGIAASHIYFRKARGTRASKTTVVTGDDLGTMGFLAWEGSAWELSAYIQASSFGTIASNRVPSYLTFWAHADAAGNPLEMMRTYSAQVQLGDGTQAANALAVGVPAAIYSNSLVSGAARGNLIIWDTTTAALGVGGGIFFGGKYAAAGTIGSLVCIKGIKENANDADYAGALVFCTTPMGGAYIEGARITSAQWLQATGCVISGGGTAALNIYGNATVTDATERAVILNTLNAAGDAWIPVITLTPNGASPILDLARSAMFSTSIDSAAVADQVSIGAYEISAGHRALAISSEEVVVTETDETKFSHKIPVRINGATYNMMLCAT